MSTNNSLVGKNSSSTNGILLFLSESDVRQCLSLEECIKANKRALISLADGTAVVPSRIGIPYNNKSSKEEDGPADVTLFKPAACYSNTTTNTQEEEEEEEAMMGMKIVSVRKNNPQQHHLPLVPATIVHMNAETGMVEAILGSTYLTAARTAAASALATHYILQSSKKKKNQQTDDGLHLVVMGAGLQADLHIQMLRHILPNQIHNITIINRSLPRAQQLHQKIILTTQAAQQPTTIVTNNVKVLLFRQVDSVKAALSTADIIVTATNTDTPLINWMEDVKAGCHINGVGSYTPHMEEVCSTFVQRRCSTILVDTLDANHQTVGDLKQTNNNDVTLLGTLLLSSQPPPPPTNTHTDCTFFKSVGTAIQDVVTAHTVVQIAKESNIGTYIPMT